MNNGTEKILHHLFQNIHLEDISENEMEKLAAKYPFYPPVQYLLAKKYEIANTHQFPDQIKKTALYFSNPHWLYGLLHWNNAEVKKEVQELRVLHGEMPTAQDSLVDDIVKNLQDNIALSDPSSQNRIIDSGITTDYDADGFLEKNVPPNPGVGDATVDSFDQSIAYQEEADAEGTVLADQQLMNADGETITEAENTGTENGSVVNEVLNSGEKGIADSEPLELPKGSDIVDEVLNNINAPIVERLETDLFQTDSEENNDLVEAVHQSLEPALVGDIEAGLEENEQESVETVLHESAEGMADPDPEEAVAKGQPVEGKLNLDLSNLKEKFLQKDSNGVPEELIPIEPLHTVDYFASQGIRLQLDGKDALSKKMKRFTEWLKVMKRIHPEKLEDSMDQSSVKSIQNMAAYSNQSSSVLTESMAEVYARQGLIQNAISIYEKLSLQNPDKSSYFASKIAQINKL